MTETPMTDEDIAAYLVGMMYCVECFGHPEKLHEALYVAPMYFAYGWFDALYELGVPWFREHGRYVEIV